MSLASPTEAGGLHGLFVLVGPASVTGGLDHLTPDVYQKPRMRWLVLFAALAAGCPAPKRYAVDRPGLECERAVRVARRTLDQLGYTVTEMREPRGPGTAGQITGIKTMPNGRTSTGRVRINCTAAGAELQPVEDTLVPNFEFSRAFGYSFTTLVQRPDVETPMVEAGVQPLLEALDVYEQRLDLGGDAVQSGTLLVRLTIRNGTDRAVTIAPADLTLVGANGGATQPLAAASAQAALAGGAAGERVRRELLSRPLKVPPKTTAVRFLLFPAGAYGEARVTLEDVETGERDGVVTSVQ